MLRENKSLVGGSIHKMQVLRLMRQIMNVKVLHHTDFAYRDGTSSLRDQLRISSPSVRTSLGSRQMSFCFNALPSEVRKISETTKFIQSVRQYLGLSSSIERLISSQLLVLFLLLHFSLLFSHVKV